MQSSSKRKSRRTSRSASNQVPPDHPSQRGNDPTTRPHTERDETIQTTTTPISAAHTPLSRTAPDDGNRAASVAPSQAPSEASILTYELGGLAIGADTSGFLLSPGGPLALTWDPTIGHNTFFEPQGELADYFERPTSSGQEFSTPNLIGADSASALNTLRLITTTSPARQLAPSAEATVDYDLPSPDMSTRAGMKRKAGSDPALVAPTGASGSSSSKRPSFVSTSSAGNAVDIPRSSNMRVQKSSAQANPAAVDRASPEAQDIDLDRDAPGPSSQKDPSSASTSRKLAEFNARLSPVLPAGKVFPIRIGSELFQLSGASISSDAPSYFSHYFSDQLLQTRGNSNAVKTLYIDRDPLTFRDIALHLQGYHIKPKDGAHYVRLFADAQFYSLPRLTQQLFKSEIFIQVGDRHFSIPRDIFNSPGNLPNFFSLGFAHFFSTPTEAFPGLDGQTLLRPPSILPPAVPNRSGERFAELVKILQGYDVIISDEEHRKELLRDCRYFHFKGVEQKIIPHEVSFNLRRGKGEITLKLEDLRQSGVAFTPDEDSPAVGRRKPTVSKPGTPHSTHGGDGPTGWISYQRPFVDEEFRELILDISEPESTKIDVEDMLATFNGQVNERISGLFQVIANKMNLPSTVPLGLMMMQNEKGLAGQPVSPANSGVSGEKVKIRIQEDADVELDGVTIEWDENSDHDLDELPNVASWKKGKEVDCQPEWYLHKSLWRLRMECDETNRTEVIMCAVKLEAYTKERYRNTRKEFL